MTSGKKRVFSRKRFQEALKACKSICRNGNLPYTSRLRAAELICLIYGLNLEWCDTKSDRQAVKNLVTVRGFDKELAKQVDESVAAKEAAEQESAQSERIASALAFLHDVNP